MKINNHKKRIYKKFILFVERKVYSGKPSGVPPTRNFKIVGGKI
tara:strand:- start:2984 stop:3115 length:132 start_codon:yes stop_codon:yes gene_type:complete